MKALNCIFILLTGWMDTDTDLLSEWFAIFKKLLTLTLGVFNSLMDILHTFQFL